MKYAILVFSLILSFPAFSQENKTYLCIAEKTSFVEKSKTEGISTKSGQFEKKYIITPNGGLKEFGDETAYLDNCHFMDNGRPNFCESSRGGWAGEFMMDSDNVFVMSGSYSFDKGIKRRYYWHVGKCSVLY